MLLVEQELLILSIHIWFLFGFMVLNLSLKCCMDYCLSFHIFYLAIVLSVLRFTTSDNPFDTLSFTSHGQRWISMWKCLHIYVMSVSNCARRIKYTTHLRTKCKWVPRVLKMLHYSPSLHIKQNVQQLLIRTFVRNGRWWSAVTRQKFLIL